MPSLSVLDVQTNVMSWVIRQAVFCPPPGKLKAEIRVYRTPGVVKSRRDHRVGSRYIYLTVRVS